MPFPFSPKALFEIYRITRGIPRAIVKLANEALIKAAVDKNKSVSRESILSASTELAVEAV